MKKLTNFFPQSKSNMSTKPHSKHTNADHHAASPEVHQQSSHHDENDEMDEMLEALI